LTCLAALAAVGTLLVMGSGPAEAAPGFKGLSAASAIEPVGYYKRYRKSFAPEYVVRDYQPDYPSYSSRSYGSGHYEIKELQRLFPETNWPPSMRYHQY
jgi:hypothetical protein